MSVQSLIDRSRVLHETLEQVGWSDADTVVQRGSRNRWYIRTLAKPFIFFF